MTKRTTGCCCATRERSAQDQAGVGLEPVDNAPHPAQAPEKTGCCGTQDAVKIDADTEGGSCCG